MRLEFGESVKELVDREKYLDVRADFIPDHQAAKGYLNRGFGNSYDFNQTA
jgi:hypothetical protein